MVTVTACPSCGHAAGPEDNFCEACQAELSPIAVSDGGTGPGACPDDPEAAVTPEGFCEACGRKLPDGRDHMEFNLGLIAGVTDRGLRHKRNEDAIALATAHGADGPAVVAVVCDGVSSASRPDEASLAAARTASRVLLEAVRAGSDLARASRSAVLSAQAAVSGLADQPGNGLAGQSAAGAPGAGAPGAPKVKGAPAATFLSAVLTGTAVTIAWAGDSRAYWLSADPETPSRRLTNDDSFAEELVAAGVVPEAEAMKYPGAHVITRWLGADFTGAQPHVTSFEPARPGVLLLCSDGLWNYRPAAADLAGLALPGALTDPLPAAVALTDFAIKAGGADNITVVLAPFPLNPRRGEHPDESAELHR